jgi:rSAM/selenodomain-associated transferase 2
MAMISVIIPVYNEGSVIGNTLRLLKTISESDKVKEIIVVDGGSEDDSVDEAKKEGALVKVSSRKGRAAQMNEGASIAAGSILYFLHADSTPPAWFATDITEAVKNGYPVGCYRLRFDLDHWFLKANAWFTRFDMNAFRYGDQSLFVTKEIFGKAGGFCEKHIVMEDQEIIKRLRKHGNFTIIPREVVTSARKYIMNGVFRMQGIFYLIYLMYQLGYPQEKLLSVFRKLVKQDKL